MPSEPRTALLRRYAASSGTLQSKHAYNPPRHLIPALHAALSPKEIHKLASQTKKAMTAASPAPAGEVSGDSQTEGAPPKAACHSDYVDPEEAKKVQQEQFVQLNTAPAHGITSEDRII